MSKKTPQTKEELFNIDREARKHYPQEKNHHSPSKIQSYSIARTRKIPSSVNRGMYSSY